MNTLPFTFCGAKLAALPSGAVYWLAERLLIVSDLHLGKTERMARRGGPMLPPYEVEETLDRLLSDIAATSPQTVLCLGDSFDDLAAAQATGHTVADRLRPEMAGRRWIWIEGNHVPGPVDIPGDHLADLSIGPLVFRHIATHHENGEVSGHYHPKARVILRVRASTRRCLLADGTRRILPAYGTYTGGLFCHHPDLSELMADDAKAILVGRKPVALPMPR